MTTRIWPHILVEDGPPVAGLVAGDMIAMPADEWMYVGLRDGSLDIEHAQHHGPARNAWRVSSETMRLERGMYWQKTQQVNHDELHVCEEDEHVLVVGRWRLRFVLDGPPLATRKLLADRLVCLPHRLGATRGGGPFCEWLLPDRGARDILVVTDVTDVAGSTGTTRTYKSEPRRSGVTLLALERASGGVGIDASVAAGIVKQMTSTQPLSYVGFDGVVRAVDGTRTSYRERSPAEAFARLRNADGVAAVVELGRAVPASTEHIGVVVRALCPAAWTREQALVEECGVLA